jgi:hypothetical protein
VTFWTDERVALMRELLATGLSAAATGRAIGASANAVIGKANRMGIIDRCHKPIRKPKNGLARPPKRHNDGEAPPPRPMPASIPGGVATIDLTARQCRFPLSADAPWFHCGQDRHGSSPYCEMHASRARSGSANVKAG